MNIFHYDVLDSTMDTAKSLISDGNIDEFAVLANRQTGGRGRHGRSWVSEKGNLYLSVVTKDVEAQRLSEYALLWGLILLEEIKRYLPLSLVECKWPNDVLIEGKKTAGILIEREASSSALVVGIGVNLLHFPAQTLFPATCLRAHTEVLPSPDMFTKSLLLAYEKYRAIWQERGFNIIRETWLKSSWKLNNEIIISQETRTVVGIFETIDENGALILKTESGYEKLLAGDLIQ